MQVILSAVVILGLIIAVLVWAKSLNQHPYYSVVKGFNGESDFYVVYIVNSHGRDKATPRIFLTLDEAKDFIATHKRAQEEMHKIHFRKSITEEVYREGA